MTSSAATNDVLAQEFVQFSLDCGVLKFGEFKTKAGRMSPYFFNAGLFDDGAKLGRLASFYAQRLVGSGIAFDMIFGPAYKGIPLAAATSIALANNFACDKPYCFNRKEAKDHGEGGTIVGAALAGRVLVVDDVITAGTAIREVMTIISQAKATAAGVLVALDREERGQQGELSAIGEIRKEFGLPVVSIIALGQIIDYLQQTGNPELQLYLPKLEAYRERYGAS
mgnify:CR=1 FL=1